MKYELDKQLVKTTPAATLKKFADVFDAAAAQFPDIVDTNYPKDKKTGKPVRKTEKATPIVCSFREDEENKTVTVVVHAGDDGMKKVVVSTEGKKPEALTDETETPKE